METTAPPDHLDDAVAEVWSGVVASHPKPETINTYRLEAYCLAVTHLRMAHDAIAREGLTVVDDRGHVVKNPALAAAKDAQEQVRRWGAEFFPPRVPRRRHGTMYDATASSIANAEHLRGRKEFAGACEAVKTLAWLIDEAQRAGLDALQAAAFGTIPSYLKGCAELQITPASVPDGASRPKRRRGGGLQAIRGGLAGATG